MQAYGSNLRKMLMSIERFADGLVVEGWENVDTASIMQQLTG